MISAPAGVAVADVRPLLTGPASADGEATVIRAPQRHIRIQGDAALLRAVLSGCDGERTVAEVVELIGAEHRDRAADLIEALLQSGALADCTRAYRTFHWQSSVESGYFRASTPDELREIASGGYVPHTRLGPGHPLEPRATALSRLCGQRASATRLSAARAVGYDELSAVLSAMYGPPRNGHRPVPSGGGLYPLVLHVVIRTPLEPLTPGVWWYDVGADALVLIRDRGHELDDVVLPEATTDALLAAREPVVFVSADLERPSRKYANRAYRWALMEVGAALQNAYLACAEMGLPIRAIGGIGDFTAHRFLELSTDAQPMLAVVLGGPGVKAQRSAHGRA